MSLLAESEKRLLLQVARRSLQRAIEQGESLQEFPVNSALPQHGGAFVTLHHRKRLRGCIGQLTSGESLVSIVAYCARAAAIEDPRFNPVTRTELSDIEVEVSVLSPLEDIIPGSIEAGRHGLLVSTKSHRGVLLPQVAAQFRWTAERFLEETCLKAGLDRTAWKESTVRIQAFTAEIFSEADFPLEQNQRQPAKT